MSAFGGKAEMNGGATHEPYTTFGRLYSMPSVVLGAGGEKVICAGNQIAARVGFVWRLCLSAFASKHNGHFTIGSQWCGQTFIRIL